MTDPQKWTDTPSPTQLRDFYAGTVLVCLTKAKQETRAAIEGGVIPERSGAYIVDLIGDAELSVQSLVGRAVEPQGSEDQETRVMK